MFYDDVWLADLRAALMVLWSKCPECLLFRGIYGTPSGNICIVASNERYIVKISDWTLWREVETAIWEEIK